MGLGCKKNLRWRLFLLHDSVAVVLAKKNDLTNQLPKKVSVRVDNAKFLQFGQVHLCKRFFGRKVAFLDGAAKNWFVIIQNVDGKIRANNIVFVFC